MMSQLRYAIIVGLSQYEHLGDLGYVAGDVQLMQGLLSRGLGKLAVPTDSLSTLAGRRSATEAKLWIEDRLKSLRQTDSSTGVLLLYCSGHGVTDPTAAPSLQFAVGTNDTRNEQDATGIGFSWLLPKLQAP